MIIRGLADKQIRREMMGDTNPDKSLKRLIASVEGKEAGNRADSRCARPDSSEHTEDHADAGSSYRKQGRQQPPPPTGNGPPLQADTQARNTSTAVEAMTGQI